jgi:RsiW-degrading membrane proteinase PrsW (M82 family)
LKDDDYISSPPHAVGDEPALAFLQRPDLPTFASEYRRRREAVRTWEQARAIALAMAVAGPFAILGALLGAGAALSIVILVVVLGPIAEELLKAAGALYLAEVRPWLVPAAGWLVVITVVAGLVFASIENAFYLLLYIDEPTAAVVRWRWIFGPLVHGTGSLLAGIGAARMWTDVDRHARPARFTIAVPWIVAGIVVHSLYNLSVTIWEVFGGGI